MSRLLPSAVAVVLVIGCGGQRPAPAPGTPKDGAPKSGAAAGPSIAQPSRKDAVPKAGASMADLPRLQPRGQFKLPGKHIRAYDPSVHVSADGKRVALGVDAGGGSFAQVWQLDGKPKAVADFPKGLRGVLALSPSGKHVLVAGPVEVFEVDTKKSLAKPNLFTASHAYFQSENVVVCTQRSHMFSEKTKGTITVWDVTKNADGGSFEVPDNRFEGAFPARDSKEFWLFQSADRFEVECYDVANKKLARSVKPEQEAGTPAPKSAGSYRAVAPDGSVFTSDVNRQLFYHGETGKIVARLPEGLAGTSAGLVPGGTRYLTYSFGDFLKQWSLKPADLILYDWKAAKGLAVLTGFSDGQSYVNVGASGDGKTVVAVAEEGEGLVFDVSSVK